MIYYMVLTLTMSDYVEANSPEEAFVILSEDAMSGGSWDYKYEEVSPEEISTEEFYFADGERKGGGKRMIKRIGKCGLGVFGEEYKEIFYFDDGTTEEQMEEMLWEWAKRFVVAWFEE